MKWISTLSLLGLVFCSGCVAVLPIPIVGHTGNHKSIGSSEVEFIKEGKTTLADVILKLGAPTWADKSVIGYRTEKYGGGWVWGWAIGAHYSGGGNMGASMRILPGYLEINFDDNSVVQEYRFVDEDAYWKTKTLCERACGR